MPEHHVLPEEQPALVARLLLERSSLRGICRVVGVGRQWLWQLRVARFQQAPAHRYAEAPSGTPAVILQRLQAELDELWSFAGTKANRQWVWVAMHAPTRQILAFHVGDRGGQSAAVLWEKIPAVYQERALFYTDPYAGYTRIIPAAQHRAMPLSLREYPFAIFRKPQSMGGRAGAARELAARTLAGRRG